MQSFHCVMSRLKKPENESRRFGLHAEQIDTTRWVTHAYLMRAELARMSGKIETAEEITERAA